MAVKRVRAKGRRESGGGHFMPRVVTNTPDYRLCSPTALKVLTMLFCQFNGYNNGDFQATFTLAKQWGIGSEATLARALRELIAAELIIKTRESVFRNPGRKCALYGVTWLGIDECGGKLEMAPTKAPPVVWSLKNKIPTSESEATGYKN